jgi:hypothetical protein
MRASLQTRLGSQSPVVSPVLKSLPVSSVDESVPGSVLVSVVGSVALESSVPVSVVVIAVVPVSSVAEVSLLPVSVAVDVVLLVELSSVEVVWVSLPSAGAAATRRTAATTATPCSATPRAPTIGSAGRRSAASLRTALASSRASLGTTRWRAHPSRRARAGVPGRVAGARRVSVRELCDPADPVCGEDLECQALEPAGLTCPAVLGACRAP